jgi:hypothetical protein
MQEHSLAALACVSSFAMIALFFCGVSLLLPRPEGKTENLRNFHFAHDPALFNKEAKCEIFYPLISALLTQPLLFVSIYVHVLRAGKRAAESVGLRTSGAG